MKKTKCEIIRETADFYHLGNRGYSTTTLDCIYLDPETQNRCALGRCFDAPDVSLYELRGTIDYDGNIEQYKDGFFINVEALLKDEYKGHDPAFWSDLQTLHDLENNWTNDGLSVKGKTKVYNLLNKWAE